MTGLRKSYGCPVEFSLDLLGGKWKMVILARLKQNLMRYGELRRAIPDLSDKVLTERLGGLREVGLVESLADADGVTRYQLTARGESLRSVLQALYDWGEAEAATLKVSIRPPAPTSD
ncbi:MAG: transcriptional regulator [Bradyrhizobium sp.]|nr:MAG: transcriptional regulator [Bradyrhizobium sp.]